MIHRTTVGGALATPAFKHSTVRSTGAAFRDPLGAPSLRPDHLANEQRKPRKRSAKRIPIAAARPLPGAEKSRPCPRHRIAFAMLARLPPARKTPVVVLLNLKLHEQL